jgi:hypothetical protein
VAAAVLALVVFPHADASRIREDDPAASLPFAAPTLG